MTDKYPKSLIRRFAKVAAFALDNCEDLYGENPHGSCGPHSIDYIEEYEDGAKVVLELLEYREIYSGGFGAPWQWPYKGEA